MAELKTQENDASVEAYLATVPVKRRAEVESVIPLMQGATGAPGRMWGKSIIGFGNYRYENTKGKEFRWMLTGVSPRKAALAVYIMPGFEPFPDLMERLGKYKTGKSCLYITRLPNIDMAVLEELIEQSVKLMRERYPD